MGNVTNQDESGTGEYDAGPVPGEVELKLEIQSDPSKGMGPVYQWDTIAPDGGVCRQRANSNIWHCQDTYSIGLNTDFFLLPTDVSFANLQFKEGATTAILEGWHTQKFFPNYPHKEWPDWFEIDNGDLSLGCRVKLDFGDIAANWHFSPQPYAAGSKTWIIPWLYSHDEGATMSCIFARIEQRSTVNAAGDATIQKGSEEPHTNNHADPDQTLGGGTPDGWPVQCPPN